jgi:aminoglycoside phosphotransferase (APT) family kinase protein
MRSKDEEALRAHCRESLPALLAAQGRPEPGNVVSDDEGWVNVCYFVDDLVVRFNARDPHLPKFEREKVAFDLLRERGLPVPRVVALDDSRSHCRFDVLMTERVPGASLDRGWSEFDADTKRFLARESGRLLAELHQQPIAEFGELAKEGGWGRHGSWRECFLSMLEGACVEAVDAGALSEEQTARARRLVEERANLLDDVKEPRLVHDDYHFGNIVGDASGIHGIVDFEWAVGGDPEQDFVNAHAIKQVIGDEATEFHAAYRELRPEPPRLRERMFLYHCLRNIELTRIACNFFTDKEASDYRRVTLAQFDRLEAS